MFGYIPLEGGYEIPMRIVGANIFFDWVLYILMLVPILFLAWGISKRVRIWRLGKAETSRFDLLWQRLLSVITFTLTQRLVIRKPLAGWMHFFVFWGFIFLFIATGSFAVWGKTGFPPLTGNIYIGFSAIVDILGFLALIGIAVLAYIRYIQKPDRLNDTKPLDGWILGLLFITLLTGYIIEGLRIAAQIELAPTIALIAYERIASPIGWIFAGLFSGASLEALLSWHRANWWFHAIISFALLAIFPYTKLWHIATGVLNYFVRDLGGKDVRMINNIEEAETFGAENIEDFTWKDLLDLDACIRCGRCQEACPAYNTGKVLNPKITIIQAMKKHLDEKAPFILNGQANEPESDVAMTIDAVEEIDTFEEKHPLEQSLIYDVVTPDVLWECTNCRGCVTHCPMLIEHISKITDMRRNLVMWQGDIPSEAQTALTNIERNYNPWGVGWASRADWLNEKDVRDKVNILSEDNKEFEYLFYGGCAVAFDDRYKKVGQAFINLLDHAGISFGYLGTEELCCGDPARRIGNEYLFQTLANQNIETFNNYGVKKIVTICPHGYNTLKNEYPDLGGTYEVYHYTEIIANLIAEGRIKPDNSQKVKISYHDSCFLGRTNGIYQPPREIITSAGGELLEIEKSKQFGFCCGAGGGRMFLEEEAAEGFKRINETRTDQLLEANPEMLVSNCPFCLTMLMDGVKTSDKEDMPVIDVAELLWNRIEEK